MNPDFEYMFWCEKTIEEKLNIPNRYKRKIEHHTAIWGKADLYRWLILEKYGGVFVDADMVAIEPIDDFLLNEPFVCYENEQNRQGLLATSIQGYPPNHIIPKNAISWIMDNNIRIESVKIESWKLVGPGLLTRTYYDLLDKSVVKILPSYYFLPDHHTGYNYTGHGKVYMTHEWGSTRNNYNEINVMKIPKHHTYPDKSIDIHLDGNDKQIKEYMKSIKSMEGHFAINVHCKKDISKYVKSMRFVKQIQNDNIVEVVKEMDEKRELKLLNEFNLPVNTHMEFIEQGLVEKYIKPTDKVLELGARYGSVSIRTNWILNNKDNHYVVEPDKKVWDCLEENMKRNNTDFNIIKGVIGKEKYKIAGNGYATHLVENSESDIECFDIPDVDFNVLIADCEGYLEIFYNENIDFFKGLNLVIFETDRPEACDYDKVIDGLNNMGFTLLEKIPEPGMKGMYHYVFHKGVTIFDTRNEMITHYANKINKPVMCELGVFRGEFLDYMEKNIDYGELHGIDLFNGNLYSGDVDGNNPEYVQLEPEYIRLCDKYRDKSNVNVYKSYTTTFLNYQPDNKYDIIYIDADHSYKGVKADINVAFEKVKDGGYIMGHDYEMNMDKAETRYEFGTKRAVDEFCEENNQSIIAKGMDGCVSFCIQVKKI